MGQGRHFGMDWLRIGAFALLILYHIGMTFVPWNYELKLADPPIDWTTIPMLGLNAWRLSLLFVVSGYASAAMLARSGGGAGAFVRSRAARLGLPIIFGMLVIVTPQPWVALVTQHGYHNGFGHFLLHDYYAFRPIDGVILPTWMHLWFVVYLLVYTLALGALMALPTRTRAALRGAVERALGGAALLPLGIVALYAVRRWIAPGWEERHTLINDWSAHAVYLPMFLFGYLLRGSDRLRAAVARWWCPAAALALAGWFVLGAIELAYPGRTPAPPLLVPVYGWARASLGWSAIVALVGFADRHLNVDGRWRATLAEAVFPFYLIHQTLILLFGYWLLATPTGPTARFVALVVATAIGCWLFYAVGRRTGPLRPWIGLKRARAGGAA